MARRALSGLALARAGALLLAGCLPPDRPYWVIDHTDALVMHFEAVERGPWGSEPPASGGPVAEAMPGDRMRVVPFVAGVDGPVDLAALRPRFFACPPPGCNLDRIAEEPPPCGPVALPVAEHCLIGAGWPLEFEVGELTDVVAALNFGVPVMMVAGTPEGPPTAECLARVAGRDQESAPVQDCLFFARTLRVGPAWRALLLAALAGLDTPVEPHWLPSEVATIEPDVPPVIASFYAWIPVDGGGERLVELPVGGTLSVRAGDRLTLGSVAAGPPQQYMGVSVDPEGGGVTTTLTLEARASIWFATAGPQFFVDPGTTEALWRAPDEPGEVFVYSVLADTRSAGAAWLRIEVAP